MPRLSDELQEEDGGPKGARTTVFGDALAAAMSAQGLTQDDLAERMGVRQPTVSAWRNAEAEPRYEIVFAIEKALGVKPGQLSRCLGYLPLEAVKLAGGVEDAIEEDPRLSEEGRETLISTYRYMVGQNTRRRGRPLVR